MTTDFRALCVELTDCLEKADWPHRYKVVFQQWVDIAHAALAEPDGPAVPNGREPASVATQPSDEEIEEWADACPEAPLEEMDPEVHGWRRCFTAKEFSETIRAALARWGRPAATPAPPEGEVAELVEELNQIAGSLNDDGFFHSCDQLWRAATLLEQLSAAAPAVVPVPVSERPWERKGWCNEQGRCWLQGKVEGDWRLLDPDNTGVPQLRFCFSHSLPAHAIPLPAPEGGEVQP